MLLFPCSFLRLKSQSHTGVFAHINRLVVACSGSCCCRRYRSSASRRGFTPESALKRQPFSCFLLPVSLLEQVSKLVIEFQSPVNLKLVIGFQSPVNLKLVIGFQSPVNLKLVIGFQSPVNLKLVIGFQSPVNLKLVIGFQSPVNLIGPHQDGLESVSQLPLYDKCRTRSRSSSLPLHPPHALYF